MPTRSKKRPAETKVKPAKKHAGFGAKLKEVIPVGEDENDNQIQETFFDSQMDVLEIDQPYSSSTCTKWFKKYAAKNGKGSKAEFVLGQEGLAKLFAAVGISGDEILSLVIPHKLGMKTMEDLIPMATWLSVMKDLKCDSDGKLRQMLPHFRNSAKNRSEILGLCDFAFNLVKNPGEKIIEKELSVALFTLMLKSSWTLFPSFIEFYKKAFHHRSLTLDTFGGCCDLANRYPSIESLREYDSTHAWPSLADEFVEFALTAPIPKST